ncbi:hypothetical protein E7T06_09540 [Deinococcus sp. Arct2-2]|uniref:hypothetical protein n=1 Tax=Deinococcus sp. Arct2-2 TaxID=2568653 RepID=UPI0010A33C82|nr:hypothetical protein [Deinococcus sp. Arct2-2]THF69988.1 hypothetical protein E7T06_09540 [Deinococcus sp. Arct2-2]
MTGTDLAAVLPLIAKSGAATVVIALLFGLSHVIREWRGGSVSEQKEHDTQQQLAETEARLNVAEARVVALAQQNHDLRYQRDSARVRLEFLELKHAEQPRSVWAADGDVKRA